MMHLLRVSSQLLQFIQCPVCNCVSHCALYYHTIPLDSSACNRGLAETTQSAQHNLAGAKVHPKLSSPEYQTFQMCFAVLCTAISVIQAGLPQNFTPETWFLEIWDKKLNSKHFLLPCEPINFCQQLKIKLSQVLSPSSEACCIFCTVNPH